jgi:hypothetical protein
MCMMCDGFSLEDALAMDAAAIAEYGFVVIGVDGERSAGHWAYTVGLVNHAAHPELVIAGPAFDIGGALLSALGRRVIDGHRLRPGDTVDLPDGVLRVGAVHPVQYELDTFNMWHNLAAIGALDVHVLEALQVVAPSSWFCACHTHSQPDLSDPAARVDSPVEP